MSDRPPHPARLSFDDYKHRMRNLPPPIGSAVKRLKHSQPAQPATVPEPPSPLQGRLQCNATMRVQSVWPPRSYHRALEHERLSWSLGPGSQRVLEQSKQRAEWERQNAEDVQKAKAEAEHMAKIFGRPPANPTTAPDAAPMVMRPSKYKPATVESCPEDNSARSNATPTFSRGVIGLEADSDSLSPKLMASAGASSLGLSSAQPDANSTTFHDTNEPDMSSAQPHPGPIASHHASELDVSDTQPRADSGLDFGPTAAYNAGPSGPNITETQEQGDEAVGVACGGGCVNALSVLRMVKANVEYQTEVTRKQVKVWEQTNIMLGELEVEFARLQAPLERQGSMGE